MAPPRPAGFELSWGAGDRLAAAVAFLREHGARRQFFPVYGEENLRGSALTCGFDQADLCLATRGGAIVGVVGLWDQSAYKQTIVRGYSGALRLLRPCYNMAARTAGAQPLRSLYVCCLCVADDAPEVLTALLRAALGRAALRGAAFLLVGLGAGDPLLPVAGSFVHIPYFSRLYLASWDEKGLLDEAVDYRVPYPEIATL